MRIIAASRSETPWPGSWSDQHRLHPTHSPLLRDFLKGGRNEHGALSRLLGPDSGPSTLRVPAMNRREEQAFPKLLELGKSKFELSRVWHHRDLRQERRLRPMTIGGALVLDSLISLDSQVPDRGQRDKAPPAVNSQISPARTPSLWSPRVYKTRAMP
ncbi:hypothetical protein NN561_015561 [Cricetulus griseus]